MREQARALTGFRNEWDDDIGPHSFRYDRELHDTGRKKVFGQAGTYDWRDSVRLCLTHRKHPSFVVAKLWSYFLPGTPDRRDGRALARLYVQQALRDPPARRGASEHPHFYEGPRMVKPPAVYIAGLLRAHRPGDHRGATGAGSRTCRVRCCSTRRTWPAGTSRAGSTPPPSAAAGWPRTARSAQRARSGPRRDGTYDAAETPEAAVAKAVEFWGDPADHPDHARGARAVRAGGGALADEPWKRRTYPIMRQNALRILVATSPDLQTC